MHVCISLCGLGSPQPAVCSIAEDPTTIVFQIVRVRPCLHKHTKTEKGKTTVQHELHSNPEENYARGPFADSTSDTDFESYNWKQSQKQVDDVNDLSEQDLNF